MQETLLFSPFKVGLYILFTHHAKYCGALWVIMLKTQMNRNLVVSFQRADQDQRGVLDDWGMGIEFSPINDTAPDPIRQTKNCLENIILLEKRKEILTINKNNNCT